MSLAAVLIAGVKENLMPASKGRGESARGRAGAANVARTQFGLISRDQALALGLSGKVQRALVHRSEWERVGKGLYRLASSKRGWEQALMSACMTSPGSVASHRAAGTLLGLDGVPSGHVEISVDRLGARAPEGVRIHRSLDLPTRDRTVINGIPSTSVVRTLIDLSAVCQAAAVELAVEDALRRGMTTVSKLLLRAEELGARGREGPAGLRKILAKDHGATTDSALESRCLQLLREWGFPDPVRQHVVRDGSRFIARLDLAYPHARLGIECDSFRFHSGRAVFDRDREKTALLAALGWTLLRVTRTDIDRRSSALRSALLRILGPPRAPAANR